MITNFELNRDLYFRAFFTLCAAAFILLCSDSAFAATTNDSNDIIGHTLCRLTSSLTGNTAKAIGTIAIFTTGISLFMGKVQWTTAALVAIGVAIIFSAGTLVDFLAGSSNTVTCATS